MTVYGLFVDPASRAALDDYPNLHFGRYKDYFGELPQVYASTRVVLCIDNGIVMSGIPTKFVGTLVSGGFALTDAKEDLISFLGEEVKAVMFSNPDELASKVEYFLARPDERRELVNAFQPKIRAACTIERLYERVLQWLHAAR